MASPVLALAGGALIGLSALTLLAFHGRIAGISGLIAGLISPRTTTRAWRLAFLAGLAGGGLFGWIAAPGAFGPPVVRSPAVWLVGGLLVGIGTRVGGGCTSGHGVCGIGRMSRRSLVATATFIATGVVTVALMRVVGAFHGVA